MWLILLIIYFISMCIENPSCDNLTLAIFSCTSPQGETSDRWNYTGSLPARLDSRQVSPHPFWSARSSWRSPCRMSHPLLLLSCCSAENKETRMSNPWPSCCSTFNSCDLKVIVLVGVRHEETLGGAAPMSVHCYRDKDTPVLWVSGGKNGQRMSCLTNQSYKEWKVSSNTFQHRGICLQTYFKCSGFYTAGFKFVEISIEQD